MPKPRKQKQIEAKERAINRKSITPQDQLMWLDKRGHIAKRERARLTEDIEKEKPVAVFKKKILAKK